MIASMQTLGERIQEALDAKQWRPNRLAAELDVDTDTVRRWVRDLNKPRVDDVPPLAERLGTTIAWLLTGEEQPFDDTTVLTIYSIIEPAERMAKRYLEKKRLTREEAQELRDALDGAAAARQMLGLEASSELDAAVAHRLAVLRAERAALRAMEETAEAVPPEEGEAPRGAEEDAPDAS
jgi:transcriptional regulator with XRE-family HTH domain